MYQIAKDKSFYWTLKVLSLVYAFPSSLEKSYLRNFFIITLMIRFSIYIIVVILPLYHMVSSIKNQTGVDLSDDISMILGGTGMITSFSFFIFQYRKWSDLYIDLEKCGQFGNRLGLEKINKKLNFYSNLYFIYIIGGVLLYGIVALLETSYCHKMNEENGLHEICGTFLPLKLPFEVNSIFARYTIFVLQLTVSALSVVTGGLISFSMYEATEVVISYLQHLKGLLVQVFDVASAEERRQRLGFCIRYHQHMLKIAKRLNKLVKYTVGHMSLICAIVFGTIGNQALKSKPFGAVLYLLGYVVALFLPCHAGQRMLDETLSVGDAVYESKWYDCDARTMKDVLFIIARCQNPEYLDALPLGSFNYPLFLLIVKSSYTYLTILQQSM